MDMFSAIGLAIAAVICGPVISNSLSQIRRSDEVRKDRR